jgi:Domain of unknown function (DUF4388)
MIRTTSNTKSIQTSDKERRETLQTATNLTFILRDLSQQQATGRLLVKLPGSLASIYLKVGDIVHATLGVKKGPEALSMILLALPESSEFRANLSAPEMTIQGTLESLLRSGSSTSTPSTSSPQAAANPKPAQTLPNPIITSPASNEAVPAGFMSDLSKLLIEIMGPIGSIVLDDALADLKLASNLPKDSVQSLLGEINSQLKSPTRQQPFQQKSASLLARYGLR